VRLVRSQDSGKFIIQIDKNLEFDVLFKIMNTCGKVGYNNMNSQLWKGQ